MASSSFSSRPLQQTQLQLSSFTHCKYSSTFNPFKFHSSLNTISTCSEVKTIFIIHQPRFSCLEITTHATATTTATTTDTDHFLARTNNNRKHKTDNVNGSVFKKHNSEHGLNGVAEKSIHKRVILKDRYAKNGRKNGSVKSRDENFARGKSKEFKVSNKKGEKGFNNNDGGEVEVEKTERGSRKTNVEGPGTTLRVGLDMCSKRGDVMGAIRLYDLARQEGVKMAQYHYAVLLYLCSSAATGVVQPAKSGSGSRCLNPADLSKEIRVDGSENLGGCSEIGRNSVRNESSRQVMGNEMQTRTLEREKLIVDGNRDEVTEEVEDGGLSVEKKLTMSFNGSVVLYPDTLDGLVQLMKKNTKNSKRKDLGGLQGGYGIHISEDVKKFALQKGFEIYEKMCLENVPMNEATLTSVARMAMSLGDGDKAFYMVKQMKELGINPRLRSYGPALSVFCSNGDVEEAFLVEEHMLEHGVYPEEPELEALLRVSVEAGRSDKVYYLLHKLRTSVRQVSPSTADVIEKWFKSKVASRVGKRKWDKKLIAEAIENGGGGWHGQGWLGKGKWSISRTSVGSDGLCRCCGEKLVTIDLDPVVTENFAKSVASVAAQREKNSSFQKFQKWLDYYGPFEAVVDAANVGLYSQRKFKPSKVNAVVNGIRQMLPSKKWPLVILHNRRITGDKMDEPFNKKLIEKWKNADALYATPTGSNDDWYWLYAAIKFKCLLVTNDEMRDHLFQLLGNDFFPKWKERHQVHFSFTETGPVFRMPPPCSVVIQESDKGHWHIPVISESKCDEERTWLCIIRNHSLVEPQVSPSIHGESGIGQGKKEYSKTASQIKSQVKLTPVRHGDQNGSKRKPREIYRNLKNILSPSTFVNHPTILPDLEAAEKLSGCIIDFQI